MQRLVLNPNDETMKMLTNVLSGEVPQVTQAIHDGRAAALARLADEASRQEASGVQA